MRALISDTVVAQHRFVISLLDRLGTVALPVRRLSVANRALMAHLKAQDKVIEGLSLPPVTACQGQEEHAILQFAIDRLVAAPVAKSSASREARLRSVRELTIHHFDREERVLLPAVERLVGANVSRRLARTLEAEFDELLKTDL